MIARRGWATLFVPLYRLGLALEDRLRAEPKELAWPVVSVGSLSAGGAGKTPVVIAFAKLLKEAGWSVDVLSRGYRRTGRGVERVWPLMAGEARSSAALSNDRQKSKGKGSSHADGGALKAERFGDEPVLIAKKAEVDVWVGADRYAAGLAAEGRLGDGSEKLVPRFTRNGKQKGKGNSEGKDNSEGKRNSEGQDHEQNADRATDGQEVAGADGQQAAETRAMHLLDDGFQHRQLGRAMDVVLVTAEDLDDHLLPAGNLREPLAALRRADVVVVREDEVEAVAKRVWPLLRDSAQMWTVRRRLVFPAPLFVFGAGLRPVAFCAIARPEGFAAMLLEAGCGVVETVAFADHHRYALRDVARLLQVAQSVNGSGFVTTGKDAVKLSAAMRERLEQVGPLMVVGLEAEFADAAAVARAIAGKVLAWSTGE